MNRFAVIRVEWAGKPEGWVVIDRGYFNKPVKVFLPGEDNRTAAHHWAERENRRDYADTVYARMSPSAPPSAV